jgi:NAD(P)-dependent dehydrogenase (short-subunit alcohol dehydrogenase family)
MLHDKVIIVTGAGSGIGEGTAIELAKEGATLVLADINAEGGENTLAKIQKHGAQGVFVQTDVSQPQQVEEMVSLAMDTYGRLDCAFNNAGVVGCFSPLSEMDVSDFDRTLMMNLRSVFLCMKYEVSAMQKSGGGSIVNMSSVMGLVGSATLSDYCASKSGVIGLTRSAALDYVQQGIRINAVCPGIVETPMLVDGMKTTPEVLNNLIDAVPIKRLGGTNDVAQAVIWLCSDRSTYINGIALPIDGAFTAS